jgi:ABC-type amino acid transport substrate-binding protein
MLITLVFIFVLYPGCKRVSEKPYMSMENITFKDIPGITDSEIEAIEAFQRQNRIFTYGMFPSTEAFIDEDGESSGYIALFCDWLSDVFQLKFKLEIFSGLTELLDKLDSGEIDFTNLTATDERLKTYLMTDSLTEATIKLIRIEGSPELSSIIQSRLPRYAFLEETASIEQVAAVLEQDSYEEIIVDNFDDAYLLLKNEEVDALVAVSAAEAAFDNYGDVYTEDFIPLIFTSASMAAVNSDLQPVISVVTKALRSSGIQFLTGLYKTGYEEYRRHKLFKRLSAEEREYLLNNPVIPFAVQPYNYPINFFNAYERKWEGITFDLLDEIEHLTGLGFQLINDEYWDLADLMELVESGKAFFIPHLIRISER